MSKINNYLKQLQEAGFEDKPKGWSDKSIDKYSKSFTSKMKGNVKSKGFFDKCVNKMQGKVDNPEGFCAALKDEAHGSTYWRGKGKSPQEAGKDVKAHQNVESLSLKEDMLQEEPITLGTIGLVYGMTVLSLLGVFTKVMYNSIIKPYTTKAQRSCRKYKGKERQACLDRYAVESLKAQIKFLESNKSKCQKSKNNEQCVALVNKKIQKLTSKLQKAQSKVS